jgi:hypothetical protein
MRCRTSFSYLSNCRQLESLTFHSCAVRDDPNLSRDLADLQLLTLSINGRHLQMAAGTRSLRHLSVFDGLGVLDPQIVAVAAGNAHLQSLKMEFTHGGYFEAGQ